MKKRIMISNLAVMLQLVVSRPDSCALFYAGLFFVLLGEAIRLVSSGTIIKSKTLTANGIYSMLRNPLYLGTLAVTFGVLIQLSSFSPEKAPNTGFIWLFSILAFLIIYRKTIAAEEAFLLERYGAEFENYMKRVPSLLPDLKNAGELFKKENYSAEAFKKNKEYRGFSGILAIEAAIILKILYGF
ncbi:MAG: hypothetical protein COT17_06035 [Elusimicrobia bacterium CG08_land_8_20_14_0_20_51_18]|nr:MAG: hypothetical protein COT17_06035 [Elusimicrobia bacterium CG08_land_8_20_14_0_20_51_18]